MRDSRRARRGREDRPARGAEQGRGAARSVQENRPMNDGAKFAVFDLLKVLDVIFDGRHHEVFRHIAWDNLNLALPALPPPPPDPPAPAPGSKAEAAGLPSDPTPCPEPEVDSVADSAADSSGVP